MTATAKQHKAARRRPQRVVVVPPPTPTITSILTDRLGPWAALAVKITAITGALGVGAWFYTQVIEGPVPVSHRALNALKTEVETTIKKGVGDVKVEVGEHVGKLESKVGSLDKSLRQQTLEFLERSAQQLFTLKADKSISLNNIEGLLAQQKMDPAQRQNLIQRKAETEGTIKYIDSEFASVRERLDKAKRER